MKKINPIIIRLMFSDIFVGTGFGLIEPILAIFIKDNLRGGTIFTVGFASTIFLISKSLTQLPFSRHVDTHDDRDDLKWLFRGTVLIAIVPFIYIFAQNIYHVFLAQLIYGIGSGLAYSTWLGLWSTHLDRKYESFEWSLYSTVVSLGTACSATIGAAAAEFIGFTFTFILVGIMSIIGCLILYSLKKDFSKSFVKLDKKT